MENEIEHGITSSDVNLIKKQATYELYGMGLFVLAIIILIFNVVFGVILLLVSASILIGEFIVPKRKAVWMFNKGVTEFSRQRYNSAAALIDDAAKTDPSKYLYDCVTVVIKYFFANDYESAKENIQHCIKKWPVPENKYILADCHYQTGYNSKAINILEYLEFADDQDLKHRILLAKCYLHKGALPLGIEILKGIVGSKRKMTKQLLDAKYWLGHSYLKIDNLILAKKQLAAVYSHNVNYLDIRKLMVEVGLI